MTRSWSRAYRAEARNRSNHRVEKDAWDRAAYPKRQAKAERHWKVDSEGAF
jgi:hypothetical protein